MPIGPFQAFRGAVGEQGPDASCPLSEVEFDGALATARLAWPGLEVDELAFARALGELFNGGATVEKMDPAELWLAVACAAGSKPAVRAFEAAYLGGIERTLGHMRLRHELLEDALQVTRRRLLIGADGKPPKIIGYAGRGQLRTLVRVVATRAALDLLRGQGRRREVPEAELSAVLLASTNPESAVGLGRKADLFQAAFEHAVAELEPADRTLLRLYVVDGVGLDGLAVALGIHRSTAARRIARIRETLQESTRQHLHAEGLAGPQLESVIGVVDAGLELTLSRILADPAEAAPEPGSDLLATDES